jgi:hypothetical protein
MKTLVKLRRAAGKTVGAVEFSFDDGQVVIAFTDGTFAAIRLAENFIDGCRYLEDGCFDVFGFLNLDRLIRAGILTEAELEDLRVRRNAAEAHEEEKRDRAEYARLKAKFDPDWYYSQVPNTREVGWYATLFCWDGNEGIFAGANRWLGDRWDNDKPVYAWAGPFSTTAEADEWARAHNPEDM